MSEKLSSEVIYQEYYINNLTLPTICKKYGIRFYDLKALMAEYGIEVKKNNYYIDEEEFKHYYLEQNHSQQETCQYFNVPYSFLRKYISKYGRKTSSNNGIRHNIPSREELIEQYISNNVTIRELAIKYETNERTIQRWFRKFDIPYKNKSERLENTYKTNLEKYGSKTKFGTGEFKEWYLEHVSDIKEKVRKTCQQRYNADSYVQSKEAKEKWKTGSSDTENRIYNKLITYFPEVIRWYDKDARYLFECDFYIPVCDLFIEYQGFTTHGNEPFNEHNPEHLKIVEQMLQNPSKYHKDTLYIWTNRDVLKRKTALENEINLLEFFTEKEFDEWFEKLPRKDEVIDYVKSVYSKEILFNEIISDVTVDMYFPKKKIAIKLDGYFWGNNKPKQETRKLLNKGIRLIHIYDYEWLKFKETFKQFINSTLNSRDKHLVRSKDVKEISKEDYVNFLKDNHLFGNTITCSSWMYGIYESGELVAVAGFNKKSGKYDYEYKRFCFKHGWMGIDIPKLFLDNFAKTHKGVIVDYQQMDRFPFSSDENLGFKKIKWNSGSISFNIKTFEFTRHDFIKEDGLTKFETMKKYGFDVILQNAGTITWIKKVE